VSPRSQGLALVIIYAATLGLVYLLVVRRPGVGRTRRDALPMVLVLVAFAGLAFGRARWEGDSNLRDNFVIGIALNTALIVGTGFQPSRFLPANWAQGTYGSKDDTGQRVQHRWYRAAVICIFLTLAIAASYLEPLSWVGVCMPYRTC
jgi:hypothetical protein